jgi:myo-inositol-1(or 4)-monophosphatase
MMSATPHRQCTPQDLSCDLPSMLALATEVAEEAAELLRERRLNGVRVAATKSSELDIVTEADSAAEQLIRSRILQARPLDGFLGEEGEPIVGSSGVTWVVDPLDGTVNYLYGAGPYAVSIAAVSTVAGGAVAPSESTTGPTSAAPTSAGTVDPLSWTALVGVVVVCTEGVTYSASLGGGAAVDGTPLSVSREERLELALVATGLGYDRIARGEQMVTAAQVASRVRDLRMGGSAATELCLVAAGRIDAYYERHLGAWDYAAGALIVREAGGIVAGAGDNEPSSTLVVASAPGIAAPLRELLSDLS